MDLSNDSPSVKADDKDITLKREDFEDKIKEKYELIDEVQTICNTNFLERFESLPADSQIQNQFESIENCESNDENQLKSFQINNSIEINFNTNNNQHKFAINDESKELYLSINTEQHAFFLEEEHKLNSNKFSNNLQDIKRISGRNNKRKKEHNEYCPICGVTVRLQDLESHYNQEVEKLSKIPRISKRSCQEEMSKSQLYTEVKKNRESRLTARLAVFSARVKNEVKCPVCNLRLYGQPDDINRHVALCFQDEDSDEIIDVEDDVDDSVSDSFQEYEIGGETRIRPISLIPGGYRALHGSFSRSETTEDEAINIDIDGVGDACSYGEPQYSELDLVPNSTDEQDKTVLEKLRKAVLLNSSVQANVLELRKWSKTETDAEEQPESLNKGTELDHVVQSLKEKIKDLEDQNKTVKCLICLESYTKPVVSTTCWHVHCEECWLMTMGVKKLCPQCNMIVFPSDLRKIYL